MTLANLLITGLTAFLGAVGILLALRFRKPRADGADAHTDVSAIMLFRDGELADATKSATKIMGTSTSSLSEACKRLGPLFPDLGVAVTDQNNTSTRIVNPSNKAQWVNVSTRNQTVRLELHGTIKTLDPMDANGPAILQDIATFSPQLTWQSDANGAVIWANDAYAKLLSQSDSETLFTDLKPPANDSAPATQRLAVSGEGEQWFDITSVVRSDGVLHFANDATALMRADQDRREFVQTLGKTFADLSIGLAIFSKTRQLAMFNPALLDMTNLPVDFLSSLPTIDTVLDRMREMRMMPEPKDYNSWREQFTAVEAAAKNGTYSENWALPDGQTYRVTGRPHPDGAFALLFEDITAEVSLTRRFRSDIETSQAVLDTLPDAIAVFSGAGTMVMSNSAYSRLWSTPEDLMLSHREVQSEFSVWQDSCIASPMWTQMRDFIQRIGTRKPWSDDAMLVDGRHLRCHALPIAGGMTMVRFVIAPPMRPVIQKLTQVDPAIRAGKI